MTVMATWFYLDSTGQNIGPYDVAGVQALYGGGYLTLDTLLWQEGLPDWQPLRAIEALSAGLPEPAAPSGSSAAAPAEGRTTDAEVGNSMDVDAGDAVDPEIDAELAAFKAEIAELEVDAEAVPASPEEKRFEDDDGTVYVWNPELRKFMPEGEGAGADFNPDDMVYVPDEEVIPEYNPPPKPGDPGYGEDEEENEEGEGAGAGNGNGPASQGRKTLTDDIKRKAEEAMEREREKAKKAKEVKDAQPKGWFEMKINTAVYVTGLPEDVTEEELVRVFSKCGVIKEGDDRRPKIKIYRDKASGLPKGDGLVTYLKEPSVELALQILDGAPFRPDMHQRLSVTKAKFEQKGSEYTAKKSQKKKSKKKGKGAFDEKKLGWDGFDDLVDARVSMVILKNMFHPDDFLVDPTLKEDLETDIKSECTKLGVVDRVRVYYHNPEGVAAVKFHDQEGADKCIQVMDGRFFGGREIKAFLWDGYTNYHVKPPQESEEEQQARLERFAQELEAK